VNAREEYICILLIIACLMFTCGYVVGVTVAKMELQSNVTTGHVGRVRNAESPSR
jgi:hypothetical protein